MTDKPDDGMRERLATALMDKPVMMSSIDALIPIIEAELSKARHEAAAEMREALKAQVKVIEKWANEHLIETKEAVSDILDAIDQIGPPEVQAAMEARDAAVRQLGYSEGLEQGLKGAEHREQQAAANALEAAAIWFDDGKNGMWHYGAISRKLREMANEALTAPDIAAKAKERPNVSGASPVCLDCNKAGLLNCSHFDNCDGMWIYKPDAAHDAKIRREAGLRYASVAQTLAIQGYKPEEIYDAISELANEADADGLEEDIERHRESGSREGDG
jgi:hypothetical protein